MPKQVRRHRNGRPICKSKSATSLDSVELSESDSSDSEVDILLPRKKRPHGNDDVELISGEKRYHPRNDKFYDLEKKIKEEIKNREISIEQVYDLDLPIDEYIWFQKHIEIRDNMREETEEKFTITNMIYNRY